MTPRSRKPITAIESLTEAKSMGFESLLEESESNSSMHDNYASEPPKLLFDQYSIEQVLNENPDNLTETFKEYLINRNLLAGHNEIPHDDDSFSSQPDDFVSSTDLKDLSETQMSESFLYCMNGNNPGSSPAASDDVSVARKRLHTGDAHEPQPKKVFIGETTL